MTLLLLIIGSLILLVALSFGVEAMRRRPTAPPTLYWAPKIPILTTVIGGNTIRYIKTGKGPHSSCCTRLELNSIYLKSLYHPSRGRSSGRTAAHRSGNFPARN